MGSIPVRSTKKRRMQFCIRRFLVFFLVNRPWFVNMACHILAEGFPLAGNGKFPYPILARAIIAILHSAFFGILSRESPSVRQYGLPYSCRGTPACGKRQIPVSNIAILHSVFFGILSRESPSVRQYGLPYSCRGTPACGKRQIPAV